MNQLIKCKAVVFDRDGIIIDSEILVINSAKKAFKQLGFDMPDADASQIIGRSSFVYTEYFLTKWDFDPEVFREKMKENFYNELDTVQIFDETIKLIKRLYKRKVALAVTTSAGREGTLLILRNIGIEHMFNEIVTREDCVKLKPDPEPYVLTTKKLGISPEYCVAIEDTSLGIESAKKAGLKSIAIPTNSSKDQDFANADFVVKSANEIEEKLEIITLN